MFGTNKKELGNLSYPKTYKTFLGLVHKFISYDKAIDGLVTTGAAHSRSFRVDIPYFF